MLNLTVREGDYVVIGGNIKVHFDYRRTKGQFAIGIDAPRDVEVIRGEKYEEEIEKRAQEGDRDAAELFAQIKKEEKERYRKSVIRQNKTAGHDGRKKIVI